MLVMEEDEDEETLLVRVVARGDEDGGGCHVHTDLVW